MSDFPTTPPPLLDDDAYRAHRARTTPEDDAETLAHLAYLQRRKDRLRRQLQASPEQRRRHQRSTWARSTSCSPRRTTTSATPPDR